MLATLLVGVVGCGGLLVDVETPEPVVDAAASSDGSSDASAIDVSVPIDTSADTSSWFDSTSWPDSMPDVSAHDASEDALDATEATDARDGSEAADDSDASDAADAADVVEENARCLDQCALGDRECLYPIGPCSPDASLLCELPLAGVSTCVVGPNGCTEWGSPTKCTSSEACCVPCKGVPCYDGDVYLCPSCPLGDIGDPCEQDDECGTNACNGVTHKCQNNQCADHRQDGRETDVDCGGDTCLACAKGLHCEYDSDCQASVCQFFVCQF